MRKKVPVSERQPLRTSAPNEVWSMDFVFDRTADARVLKCLTIVDDATHEAVGIEVERAISGTGVTRVLDRLAIIRGLPKTIRTDNGKEFCGKAMVAWAHAQPADWRTRPVRNRLPHRWQHLNFFQFRAIIEAQVPCVGSGRASGTLKDAAD